MAQWTIEENIRLLGAIRPKMRVTVQGVIGGDPIDDDFELDRMDPDLETHVASRLLSLRVEAARSGKPMPTFHGLKSVRRLE